MDLSVSFASLVKTNNGFFKSEKQAKFLLDMCQDGSYLTGGSVFGNSFNLRYICDARGIVSVEKHTTAKGFTVQWQRVEEGQVSVQDAKEIKRIKREMKAVEASISNRQKALDEGRYTASKELFDDSMKYDAESLEAWQERLNKYL